MPRVRNPAIQEEDIQEDIRAPPQLDYDAGLLRELRRVYGGALSAALQAILEPPARYYVRVNVLRADPGTVLDEMRAQGLEVYADEELPEALWLPVRGPVEPRDTGCRLVVDKRAAESIMLGANVYAPGVVALDEACANPGAEVTVVSENGVPVANAVLAEDYRRAMEEGRGLVAVNVRPRYRVPSLRDTVWWRRGVIYEQSLPSMYASRILDPEPGAVIVDMCAAPGGKTSHIYELVRGEARIIAVDHSARKTERMRMELGRLGHTRIEVIRADSRYLDRILGSGVADYVLLDPPCTSLGVIPKIYDRKTLRDVANTAEYQRQFLRAAAKLLKPGGVLVYSTCTMTLMENEENTQYAIEKLGLNPEEPQYHRFSRGLNQAWYAQRSHPHVHRTTGYYIARLRKKP
ncbi:PUA domain-containing protein [Hyperthermus butylicus]|uniref:tRNA (cytosine(72)-C(5))-methyltransferase n=1 Tax=Hyperthermus butylicus (strain DSM 5456 / JCM 9403 / PLM1-5) TaxID=415426 RepID=A2BKR1_HYPBU|nr:PUA domain-containing protein [Hyperthermus butylicus]ABM80572.1 ribosomal RNA small subunit methyltransferase B [Hyperthermus butylicus DSM 5456]